MGSAESLSSHPEEKKERIHKSVRIVAVAGIPVGELEERLREGMSPDEIPLVEAVLARKNDTNLVTAIGGQEKPDEDLLHASMNRVFEKTLLTRESRSTLSKYMASHESIPYVVQNWEDTFRTFWSWLRRETYHREADLVVMPVRSRTVSLHEPREDLEGHSVYRISELVQLKLNELEALFETGMVTTERDETFEMFGHLTLAPSAEVHVSDEGRQIQKREFARIISEIRDYEHTVRSQTIAHINRERRWLKKPQVTNLRQCRNEEIARGFLAAKMVMGLQDEKLRDVKKTDTPPKAADLPKAALYLREFLPEDLQLALSMAMPREVLRVASTLKYALRGTVEYLYDAMEKKVPDRPFDIVSALRDIWPDVIDLRPNQRMRLLRELDYHFIDELTIKLGVPRDVISGAMRMPERLPKYLSDELQKIKDTFQELHPTNEASSAIERPFMQMLYILGLDPYENVGVGTIESNAHARTRGEILMHEAIIFSSIPIVERRPDLDNYHFNAVLASLLEEPQDDQLDLAGVPHVVFQRRTKVKVGDRKLWLWVDKRALKLEEREVIKSFQDPEITDDFSYNLVVLDENFTLEERKDIPARLDRSAQLREAILDKYQQLYAGSGWVVSIKEGTHKMHVLQTVRDVLNIQSKRDREEFINGKKSGDRAGSVGNTIIREKFVISLKKDNLEHCVEVCIYPLETVDIDGTVLKGSDLLAFIEKLADDKSGRHSGERLLKTDPDDPTAPSVIELVYPAAWYRSFFDTIKLRQHKPTT